LRSLAKTEISLKFKRLYAMDGITKWLF